jgi:hypothetical protein
MRDDSLLRKKDGRVYKMYDGITGKPIPFSRAKHNYTKGDLDMLNVGGSIGFTPVSGNENPVPSIVVRIK